MIAPSAHHFVGHEQEIPVKGEQVGEGAPFASSSNTRPFFRKLNNFATNAAYRHFAFQGEKGEFPWRSTPLWESHLL
jgi:hypothetical protein